MKLIDILILIWLSSFSGTCQSKIDLCDKKTALKNLETVRKDAQALISEKSLKSQDNCVLEFIDTLTNGFIKNQTKDYLTTLDAICQVGDGYVGEYLWDITARLTFESFDSFIEYLSLQKENSCFEKNLLTIINLGIVTHASTGDNLIKSTGDNLIKLIDEKLNQKKTNQKTKNYLTELRKKLME